MKKISKTIDKIDLKDENAVNVELRKAGLYSRANSFPIASLQFELTTHCNVICRHCYNNSGIRNGLPDAMTAEKWKDFARYLVEHGGVFECIISGGEPLLLGTDLFDIMDILHDDETCFMLLTNGYLLNEETIKRLKKYRYHWLQISIDGVTAEYHDSFRKKKGSWERAVKGAIVASTYGIPVKIAHCVTPNNLYDIDEMCAFALSLGVDRITIGELCLSGRTAQEQKLLLSDAQRRLLYEKIEENAARYQGKMQVKGSNGIRAGLKRHSKKPNSGAIIRPNGDIRIDGMAPFVIGNVLKDDFAEVWTKKINSCWDDPKVLAYISQFDDSDRNYFFINYMEEDIHI